MNKNREGGKEERGIREYKQNYASHYLKVTYKPLEEKAQEYKVFILFFS